MRHQSLSTPPPRKVPVERLVSNGTLRVSVCMLDVVIDRVNTQTDHAGRGALWCKFSRVQPPEVLARRECRRQTYSPVVLFHRMNIRVSAAIDTLLCLFTCDVVYVDSNH